MKKVSVRGSMKPLSMKQSNVRFNGGDQEKNPSYNSESNSMVASQGEYIENLQQQIYVLENEISYLQTHLQESNKHHPSMVAEGEKMVKKLSEHQKEIQNMKIELKRKQTSIDLFRSERDRIQRQMEEFEEKFRKEKSSLLGDLITMRKERDNLLEKNVEAERMLAEEKQIEMHLREDWDNLVVELEHVKREVAKDKELITDLLETKEKLQKELFEARMTLEAKPSQEREEVVKTLKLKVEELHEQMETSTRLGEHERLLRTRLSEDNAQLIKRHADLEAELAEAKALLREEQSLRSSLEQIHLSTVLEASEAKSRDLCLREEVNRLTEDLKHEKEHSFQLSVQVSDEQRMKSREEQKLNHIQERFQQREDKIKVREKENIELLRDKTFYKDQVHLLKETLQDRDKEVVTLKGKVQEMQVSVEEFIQSSHAASRVAGERWKQLNELAMGIQALTSVGEDLDS